MNSHVHIVGSLAEEVDLAGDQITALFNRFYAGHQTWKPKPCPPREPEQSRAHEHTRRRSITIHAEANRMPVVTVRLLDVVEGALAEEPAGG